MAIIQVFSTCNCSMCSRPWWGSRWARSKPALRSNADALRPGRRSVGFQGTGAGIGAICICTRKQHLIRWITYWYGGLVVWNLMVLLAAPAYFLP